MSGNTLKDLVSQKGTTLWIQDQNGVSKMVRVLQATSTCQSPKAPKPKIVQVSGCTEPKNALHASSISHIHSSTACMSSSERRNVSVVVTQPSNSFNHNIYSESVTPKRPLKCRSVILSEDTLKPKHSFPERSFDGGKGDYLYQTPTMTDSSHFSRLAASDPHAEHGTRSSESKKRRVDKSNKGLRHFSMRVCEKVRTKGTTTYNEVADELVAEYADQLRSESPLDFSYDQKNIRRRVYDALNVLMAIQIISKVKKEIRWLGFPTNSLQKCKELQNEEAECKERIRKKTQQLKDLVLQQVAFKRLVDRNRKLEESQGPPSANSIVQLPFIVVNTNKKTVVDCSISSDKMEYLFQFDDTFEIHDDVEVLKRMGMCFGLESGSCSGEALEQAKTMVSPALVPFLEEISEQCIDSCSDAASTSVCGGSEAKKYSAFSPIDFDTNC